MPITKIERLTREFVADILGVIKLEGEQTISKNCGTPRAKRTAAQMRCRYEHGGVRCRQRSRGPRFRYLCAEHSK